MRKLIGSSSLVLIALLAFAFIGCAGSSGDNGGDGDDGGSGGSDGVSDGTDFPPGTGGVALVFPDADDDGVPSTTDLPNVTNPENIGLLRVVVRDSTGDPIGVGEVTATSGPSTITVDVGTGYIACAYALESALVSAAYVRPVSMARGCSDTFSVSGGATTGVEIPLSDFVLDITAAAGPQYAYDDTPTLNFVPLSNPPDFVSDGAAIYAVEDDYATTGNAFSGTELCTMSGDECTVVSALGSYFGAFSALKNFRLYAAVDLSDYTNGNFPTLWPAGSAEETDDPTTAAEVLSSDFDVVEPSTGEVEVTFQ